MRAPLVGTILLTLALCSCASRPEIPQDPQPVDRTPPEVTQPSTPVAKPADAALEARIEALENEIATLRGEIEVLRISLRRLRVDVNNNPNPGPDTTQNPPEKDRLRQLAEIVAKQSDVRRAWMGQINGVSIVLYPMTVAEYAEPLNKQLGAEYCYMIMVAVNDNQDSIWTYTPKKGLVVAQFDKKPGETKADYIQCRDPMALIEIEENKINRKMVETRARFEGRELKPGEQMDTIIVFEKGTDFGKVIKLYLGEIVVPEIELPEIK